MTDRKEARAKAEATRKLNAAARKAARIAQDQQEEKDKTIIAEAMRGVLSDQKATAKERIFAVLTLDHIGGDLVPWKAAQLYRDDIDKEAFKKAVNRISEM